MDRRTLITGAAALALMAGLPRAADAFMFPSVLSATTGGLTGYPGQSGNPVGYAATPAAYPSASGTSQFPNLLPAGVSWPGAYPGSLTSHGTTGWTSGTSGAPTVYSFLDIDAGSGGVTFTSANNWIVFIGCRFQSNSSANANVQINGATNIFFFYCSFTPRTALYTAPPGAAWPSANVGVNNTTQTTNTNCIDGNSGYQYGLNVGSGGPCTAQYCDFWGFGNGGPLYYSTTATMVADNCWVHDAANPSPQSYHTDATGYLNGATPPNNVTVNHCTLTSLGNTNALAFQAATSAYNNITLTNNYVSGFGYAGCFFQPGSGGATNCTITDNVFASDIAWVYGPIYGDPTSLMSVGTYNNLWRRNTFKFYPGTAPVSGSTFTYTSADNGKYLYPNSTMNATTDYAG